MPEIGQAAPAFSVLDANGETVRLSDFAGRPVVLYFYPKDHTSGCTTEACDFRDLHPDFAALDVEVLGVSRDSVGSHRKFADKLGLPFRLLADPDETLCRAYDVIREKVMCGRKCLGIERSTFLLDGQGVVRALWRKVNVKGHAEMVLSEVRALSKGA
jgi:peroxiredoxin Q/BCP